MNIALINSQFNAFLLFPLQLFFLEERFIVGLGKPNGPGGEGKSKRG